MLFGLHTYYKAVVQTHNLWLYYILTAFPLLHMVGICLAVVFCHVLAVASQCACGRWRQREPLSQCSRCSQVYCGVETYFTRGCKSKCIYNHQPSQSPICTAQVVLNASGPHLAATQYVLILLNVQSILPHAVNLDVMR